MNIAVKLKKAVLLAVFIGGMAVYTACRTEDEQKSTVQDNDTRDVEISGEETKGGQKEEISEEDAEMKMNVQVGTENFTATLEDNEAVAAFTEMMKEEPVVIQMSDYSGFEKVGSLGTILPASNSQITTQTGDIVLYNNSQIVIFYGSNSWSYTRLGRIDDLTGWEEALGGGDVTLTFSTH